MKVRLIVDGTIHVEVVMDGKTAACLPLLDTHEVESPGDPTEYVLEAPGIGVVSRFATMLELELLALLREHVRGVRESSHRLRQESVVLSVEANVLDGLITGVDGEEPLCE